MHCFLLPHAGSFYAGMLGLSNDHGTDPTSPATSWPTSSPASRTATCSTAIARCASLERQDIDGIFQQLDALGWINQTAGPRPSSPTHWIVNPAVHRLFAQRAEREATERVKQRAMLAEMFGRRV